MWSGHKVAVYTGTRNMYRYMPAAVKSLLANSDVDDIWLLIEDDEFPKEYNLPECIHTRNLSNQKYFPKDGPNFNSGWTYMALIRAALYKEFPDLDRVLSLDVDTIVVKDISAIWNLPLEDKYYFAASDEVDTSFKWSKKLEKKFLYTNVGVCLMNLEKFRDGTGDRIIEELNTVPKEFLEQETMNTICQGSILELDSKYNAQRYTKHTDYPHIVHYCGYWEWDDQPLFKTWNEAPWENVLKYRKRIYNK